MKTREMMIDQIEVFPNQLWELVGQLDAAQLTARPVSGEWSIAQNVHHLADSHLNSYVRCKLMLTETHPTLKPYDEALWAELPDANTRDLSATFALLEGLHRRWALFWRSLPDDAWARTGYHPEVGEVSLEMQLRAYVDHGRAHLDQIRRNLTAL